MNKDIFNILILLVLICILSYQLFFIIKRRTRRYFITYVFKRANISGHSMGRKYYETDFTIKNYEHICYIEQAMQEELSKMYNVAKEDIYVGITNISRL